MSHLIMLTDKPPTQELIGELAGSGITIEQALAAQNAAAAAPAKSVSTDGADLRHEIELMQDEIATMQHETELLRERYNALVAVLMPYYRTDLQSFVPLD